MSKIRFIFSLAFAGLLGGASSHCATSDEPSGPLAESPFVDEVYHNHESERLRQWMLLDDSGKASMLSAELARCPCWQDLWGDETEIAAGIVRICEQFDGFGDKAIAAGVRQYWKKYCGHRTADEIRNGAKLYLFLRVIFDVPDTYPLSEMKGSEQSALGPFWYLPAPGQVALLWPLKRDGAGKIILSVPLDRFSGHGPYDGLEDYRFLSKHFNRRSTRQ